MSDENGLAGMGAVIQIDESRIRDHRGETVRGTVEETPNAEGAHLAPTRAFAGLAPGFASLGGIIASPNDCTPSLTVRLFTERHRGVGEPMTRTQ